MLPTPSVPPPVQPEENRSVEPELIARIEELMRRDPGACFPIYVDLAGEMIAHVRERLEILERFQAIIRKGLVKCAS